MRERIKSGKRRARVCAFAARNFGDFNIDASAGWVPVGILSAWQTPLLYFNFTTLYVCVCTCCWDILLACMNRSFIDTRGFAIKQHNPAMMRTRTWVYIHVRILPFSGARARKIIYFAIACIWFSFPKMYYFFCLFCFCLTLRLRIFLIKLKNK